MTTPGPKKHSAQLYNQPVFNVLYSSIRSSNQSSFILQVCSFLSMFNLDGKRCRTDRLCPRSAARVAIKLGVYGLMVLLFIQPLDCCQVGFKGPVSQELLPPSYNRTCANQCLSTNLSRIRLKCTETNKKISITWHRFYGLFFTWLKSHPFALLKPPFCIALPLNHTWWSKTPHPPESMFEKTTCFGSSTQLGFRITQSSLNQLETLLGLDLITRPNFRT